MGSNGGRLYMLEAIAYLNFFVSHVNGFPS